MNEIRTLLEKVWICKDIQKDMYYRVKHDIPLFQKFVREQLGWRLINTENLIKLEKIPAHAQSFMGIQDFTEIRDYCLLCVILMYLEDKEEGEQFLLSELIGYLELQLKALMEIDWTSFGLRKSLVRVLQFTENNHMLQVYEGKSEEFGRERGSEVLYENTGNSKYFATNFAQDISKWNSVEDFDNMQLDGVDSERGKARINRVYRQLLTCPMMYWENNEDADSLYLKNQRQWVAKYLEENVGGSLEIHKNVAFWMLDEDDCYGKVHPRDAMLPEIVTLMCALIREKIDCGEFDKQSDECCYLSKRQFEQIMKQCQQKYQKAWSKEFREMPFEKVLNSVKGYMESWMMIKQLEDESVRIYPIVGKTSGFYPVDFEEKMNE